MNKPAPISYYPFLALLFLLSLCLSSNAVENSADSTNRALSTIDPNLEKFGQEIANTWNEKDIDKINLLIDFQAMGSRAAHEIFTKQKDIDGFTSVFTKNATQSIAAKTLFLLNQTKGTTRFIRLNRRGTEYRPLVRFELGDSGYDYQECVVEKDEHGDYKIVDWFQLSQGELVSKSIIAAAKEIFRYHSNPNEKKSGKMTGSDSIAQLFNSINKYETEGKYAEAIDTFEKLPPEILESKVFMMKWVLLASLSNNDQRYRKALSRLAEKYGQDPSGAFMLIDYYFYNNDLDKAIEAINLVESDFIKDGVTTQLKASLFFKAEKFAEVIPFAQESIELEPDREDSYWLLARSLLSLKRYSEAVDNYKKMEEVFGYKFARKNFTDDAIMKSFAKSAEFKSWMKSK